MRRLKVKEKASTSSTSPTNLIGFENDDAIKKAGAIIQPYTDNKGIINCKTITNADIDRILDLFSNTSGKTKFFSEILQKKNHKATELWYGIAGTKPSFLPKLLEKLANGDNNSYALVEKICDYLIEQGRPALWMLYRMCFDLNSFVKLLKTAVMMSNNTPPQHKLLDMITNQLTYRFLYNRPTLSCIKYDMQDTGRANEYNIFIKDCRKIIDAIAHINKKQELTTIIDSSEQDQSIYQKLLHNIFFIYMLYQNLRNLNTNGNDEKSIDEVLKVIKPGLCFALSFLFGAMTTYSINKKDWLLAAFSEVIKVFTNVSDATTLNLFANQKLMQKFVKKASACAGNTCAEKFSHFLTSAESNKKIKSSSPKLHALIKQSIAIEHALAKTVKLPNSIDDNEISISQILEKLISYLLPLQWGDSCMIFSDPNYVIGSDTKIASLLQLGAPQVAFAIKNFAIMGDQLAINANKLPAPNIKIISQYVKIHVSINLKVILKKLKLKWELCKKNDFFCIARDKCHACALYFNKKSGKWLFYDPSLSNILKLSDLNDLVKIFTKSLTGSIDFYFFSFEKNLNDLIQYKAWGRKDPAYAINIYGIHRIAKYKPDMLDDLWDKLWDEYSMREEEYTKIKKAFAKSLAAVDKHGKTGFEAIAIYAPTKIISLIELAGHHKTINDGISTALKKQTADNLLHWMPIVAEKKPEILARLLKLLGKNCLSSLKQALTQNIQNTQETLFEHLTQYNKKCLGVLNGFSTASKTLRSLIAEYKTTQQLNHPSTALLSQSNHAFQFSEDTTYLAEAHAAANTIFYML